MITVRELVSGDDGWSWWWGRMCRERESKCICVPQIFWMRVSGDYWNANLKNRCGVLPSLTFQGNSKLSSHHSTNILLIYFTLLHDGTNKLTSKLSQKTQPNKIQKLHPKSRIQPLAPESWTLYRSGGGTLPVSGNEPTKSDGGANPVLTRQRGQLGWFCSHWLIHSTWNICAHSGKTQTSSPSLNSLRQTAHTSSLHSLEYFDVTTSWTVEFLLISSWLFRGIRCIWFVEFVDVWVVDILWQITIMQWKIATSKAPVMTPRNPTKRGVISTAPW